MSAFGSASDPTLIQNMLIKQPSMYISKQLYAGSGVAAVATNDVTLTPAVSPGWTTNALQSAVGKNIVVQDKNGNTFLGKVKSNTATAVVFDATAAFDVKATTTTAGVGTNWTVGNSYYFYVLEPHATYAFGDYLGDCKEIEVTPKYDTAPFKFGIPERTKRKDVVGVEWAVKAKHYNITNPLIWQALFNSVTQGDQTTYYEEQMGFSPDALPVFRLSSVGFDTNNKDFLLQFHLGQLAPEGSLSFSSKEHKGMGFIYDVIPDTMRDVKGDLGRFQRLK